MKNTKPIVAAFDFDGTLTYRDTLFPFLLYADGIFPALGKLALQSPSLIKYLVGGQSRQETKEAVLTRFFAGKSREEVNKKGADFAAQHLDKHIRPEGWERLQWHQQQGHRCVLVSASLDVYLEPWGKRTGFQNVISSKMDVDAHGFTTGKLVGLNCWGPEKTRRMEEILGPRKDYILYAYGDSRGDQEMLETADFPFKGKIPPAKGRNL